MVSDFKSVLMIVGRSVNRSTRIGICAAIAALAAWSCLPDPLEVESIPKAKTEIVVSSQIIPDQSLVVLLTKTFGALDASDDSDPETLLDMITVNDAVVVLEGPDSRDTLLFLGNGVYGGVFIPFEAGDLYRLNIHSAELGDVTATSTVMRTVNFDRVDADLYYNGYNDTLADISYTISDLDGKNYYMLNVQEVEREDFVENLLNPRAFTVLISDDEFNGMSYSDEFRVFPRDYQPGDTIAVSLSNISEEYYRFMELRIDNRYSFVEFISEPVNYPSNVVGGRGYFNLYVPDVRFFVFD